VDGEGDRQGSSTGDDEGPGSIPHHGSSGVSVGIK
jgi:hypothetical protein